MKTGNIRAYVKQLRLPTMVRYKEVVHEAEERHRPYDEFLAYLLVRRLRSVRRTSCGVRPNLHVRAKHGSLRRTTADPSNSGNWMRRQFGT